MLLVIPLGMNINIVDDELKYVLGAIYFVDFSVI